MKKIIIAPLNWGLGHATRCVPIIRALLSNDVIPVIASDGIALKFLQKEFPALETLQLPAYDISYGKNLKISLLTQAPKIWKAVQKEQQIIEDFVVKNKDVIGIISDNRFGVRSSKVHSVYITHQINVLSGFATFLTSEIHQQIIEKFDECWVPDTEKSTFSGKLSIIKNRKINTKFIGVLSRFQYQKEEKDIAILAIISGVEPNRTSLETRLKKELQKTTKKVVIVCGKVEEEQKITTDNNLTIYNFAISSELENLINRAKIVVCRSGYSSIMDVAVLQKKVFFIPTKQQTEQEYLANYLSAKNIAPYASEEKFTIENLEELKGFKGLSAEKTSLNSDLFRLFKRK